MKCPNCGHNELLQYRTTNEDDRRVRERHCSGCRRRFLTVESIVRPLADARSIKRKSNELVPPSTNADSGGV